MSVVQGKRSQDSSSCSKPPWGPRRPWQARDLEGHLRLAYPSRLWSFRSKRWVQGANLTSPEGPRHPVLCQLGPHLSEDGPDQRGQALRPRLPLDGLRRLQTQSVQR